MLLSQTLFWFLVPPFKVRHTLFQMARIGVSSLPIVSLIAVFIGMVLAFQTAYSLGTFGAEIYIASIVALSVTREISPVLTALIVAGRVGASITAELGTMKVTEQIDALESLATNPVKYLVVPRFVATVLMLPLLTVYSDYVGILGGYLIGIWKLGIGSTLYMKMTWDPLVLKDIFTGLFKSLIFGVIIAVIACFEGLRTEGGAEGVGRATTLSVVMSFIFIIAMDCFITAIFYFI